MKKKHGGFDVSKFQKDDGDTLSQRAAKFLAWAAKETPGTFFPPSVVVRAIMGYRHTPRLDGDEVKKFRGGYSRIRKLLWKGNKDLIVEKDVGIRGTVDDVDVMKVSLPKVVKGLSVAKVRVVNTAALIDPSNVPRIPANLRALDHFKAHVRPLLATISSPAFDNALLPPSLPATPGAK